MGVYYIGVRESEKAKERKMEILFLNHIKKIFCFLFFNNIDWKRSNFSLSKLNKHKVFNFNQK